MKNSFKKALKIFKYVSILFAIVYWVYILIDDYSFIEKYWNTHWQEYLVNWTIFFLIYFLALAIYYWGIASILILIYHKFIKRTQQNDER